VRPPSLDCPSSWLTGKIYSKRTGLQKAVHQVEQAIRKSQTRQGGSQAALLSTDLQDLLKKTRNAQADIQVDSPASDLIPAIPYQSRCAASGDFPSAGQDNVDTNAINSQSLDRSAETGDLADAENPLQLLAQTSELMQASATASHTIAPISVPRAIQPVSELNFAADCDGVARFFGRFRPRLDVEPELDPIEIGLITLSEASALFDLYDILYPGPQLRSLTCCSASFFQNLAHTRWGVDPDIHTTAFVRSRSMFLLTSICAASALFLPSTAAISKRLSLHCRKLAQNIIKHRYRSVEIVLAFMVNVPWMPPGEHWADDESCTYLSMALTIAMDLSLHKIIKSSPQSIQLNQHDRVAEADCISARKALDLDGFEDIEQNSPLGRRLLRRRERAWLSLFVLERG